MNVHVVNTWQTFTSSLEHDHFFVCSLRFLFYVKCVPNGTGTVLCHKLLFSIFIIILLADGPKASKCLQMEYFLATAHENFVIIIGIRWHIRFEMGPTFKTSTQNT